MYITRQIKAITNQMIRMWASLTEIFSLVNRSKFSHAITKNFTRWSEMSMGMFFTYA